MAKETQFSLRFEQQIVEQAEALAQKTGLARAAVLRMAVVEGLAVLQKRFSGFPVPEVEQGKRPRRAR